MNSRCEDCKFRKKAELKPNSIIGILWRMHTLFCPGWKSYQKELTKRRK